MSASSKTMTGALPPSSRWTRLRSAAAELGDLHAGAHRAGDRDHLRGLVLDQRAAGVAVAADDVEHARAAGTPGRARPAASSDAGVVSLGLRTIGVAARRAPGRSSRSSSSAGSSTASPGRRRRSARGGSTRCGRPCTPPPTCPRAPARRRRRTGSGRRRSGISSDMVRPSGLPVSLHSTALISSTRVVDRVGDLEQRGRALLRRGVAPGLEGRRPRRRTRGRRPRRPTSARVA